MKWTLAVFGVILTVGSGDNPGLGAAAAGLFVSATLLHLYEQWRYDTQDRDHPTDRP